MPPPAAAAVVGAAAADATLACQSAAAVVEAAAAALVGAAVLVRSAAVVAPALACSAAAAGNVFCGGGAGRLPWTEPRAALADEGGLNVSTARRCLLLCGRTGPPKRLKGKREARRLSVSAVRRCLLLCGEVALSWVKGDSCVLVVLDDRRRKILSLLSPTTPVTRTRLACRRFARPCEEKCRVLAVE